MSLIVSISVHRDHVTMIFSLLMYAACTHCAYSEQSINLPIHLHILSYHFGLCFVPVRRFVP